MQKKTIKKEMKIEDLAGMVARGFERVEEKIEDCATKEEMSRGFVEVEKTLNKVRLDILEVGDRFVSKHQFEELVSRFNILEAKVKTRK